jgi:hypothetical protein
MVHCEFKRLKTSNMSVPLMRSVNGKDREILKFQLY